MTIKLVAVNSAELRIRDELLNTIIGILPPEIYRMYIMKTSVVNLLSMIKKEYELLTLAGKSMF